MEEDDFIIRASQEIDDAVFSQVPPQKNATVSDRFSSPVSTDDIKEVVGNISLTFLKPQ